MGRIIPYIMENKIHVESTNQLYLTMVNGDLMGIHMDFMVILMFQTTNQIHITV